MNRVFSVFVLPFRVANTHCSWQTLAPGALWGNRSEAQHLRWTMFPGVMSFRATIQNRYLALVEGSACVVDYANCSIGANGVFGDASARLLRLPVALFLLLVSICALAAPPSFVSGNNQLVPMVDCTGVTDATGSLNAAIAAAAAQTNGGAVLIPANCIVRIALNQSTFTAACGS